MPSITAYDLFPRKPYRNQTMHDVYIREHYGICTALIAIDLDVTERFIIRRQRKLGLRPLTGNKPRRAHNVG